MTAQSIQVDNEVSVIVQHDWFNIVKNAKVDATFYVAVRKGGEKCNFIDIVQEKGELSSKSSDVSIEKFSAQSLRVNYDGVTDCTFVAPCIEFNTMHSSCVQSVDVSCSGKLVVSSDTNGELAVWNGNTGDAVRQFSGHALDVNKCRFFPSGLVVLSAGLDMTLRIWSIETGQCERILKGHHKAVLDIGIIDRGREVLSCSKDGTAKLWSCGEGQCSRTWSVDAGYVSALDIQRSSSNEDSVLFAVAAERSKASLYDIRSPKEVTSFNLSGVVGSSIAFSKKDTNYLYLGSESGIVYALDMRARSAVAGLKTSRGASTKLAFHSSLGLVGAFYDGSVCTCSIPTSNISPHYEFSGADCDPVYDFAFSSDQLLFTACRDRVVRKYRSPYS